ncbi:MAG: hypothetical protein IPK87_16435 [Planctomycetes bacterium]|nr:hypothetical protein [Planctomycetota bacterium]
MEAENNEEGAPGEGEVVYEDDDADLDLGDLAEPPHRETVRERLQKAAKRRTTKVQERNWHDTPVDVTPSGRHEVIEWSAEDDIADDDVSEIITGPGVTDISDLDESSLGEGAPAGPMTVASREMMEVEDVDDETDIGELEIPVEHGSGSSGPMTVAAQQMDAVDELTESTLGKTEGPPETALEWESNIAQDQARTGDEDHAGLENQAGQTENLLLDKAAQKPDPDQEAAATPAQTFSAEGLDQSDVGTEPSADVGAEAEGEDSSQAGEYSSGAIATASEPEELDLGGEEEEGQANQQDSADADEPEMVSAESTPAEPREEVSQQPEVFTVGDDSGAPLGRGLDVGTANLVAARMDEEGSIEFFPARNAFLDVPEDPYTLKMLKGQGVPYIKRENKLFIIGEDAFELANIFNREMRRPMKNGLISPTDADAMPMEVELFKKILGPPRAEGEMVYYSIPADPVDSTMNIVYHTNIANGLLERLGYRGHPFNEGQAIVFSELGDDEFTGIGISCGGGMVNVCVCFRSMPVISFSTAKGGDWIDQQAAQVMGCAASKITAVKERGVDINAPKTPEEEAIVIYYRHLIKYSLDNIVKKFAATKDIPNFPKPVPIAVSGGTSKVGGFVEVFKDEFSKLASKFPIKISDIRKAEDQLNATAKGCLLAALSHED